MLKDSNHSYSCLYGLVVTYNERRRLAERLRGLAFCDEIIIVDLGSTDGSVDIARACGARVIHHSWVPIIEHIRQELLSEAQHDWVLFPDPGEVLPDGMGPTLTAVIEANPRLALIRFPVRFYFLGKPLYHTFWGRMTSRGRVVHRCRVTMPVWVHSQIQVEPGYEMVLLGAEATFRHYWVDSIHEMVSKHRRYRG